MSEYKTRIVYSIGVEGAEESITEFQTVLSEVSRGINLVSQLDYMTIAWQQAAQKADLRSFLSLTISTISTLNTVIALIRNAEMAQRALNTALAIYRMLEGPGGWAILAAAAAATAAGGGFAIGQMSQPRASMEPFKMESIPEELTLEEAQRLAEFQKRAGSEQSESSPQMTLVETEAQRRAQLEVEVAKRLAEIKKKNQEQADRYRTIFPG